MCAQNLSGKMSDEEDERGEVSDMSSSEEMEDYSSIFSDNDDWEKGNSGYSCEPEYSKEELMKLGWLQKAVTASTVAMTATMTWIPAD